MENKELLAKAWSTYLTLSRGMGEDCWKIRAIYLSLSSALTAFAYTSDASYIYGLVAIISPVFFLFESGYRRLQYQYYAKCRIIERTLNDYLASKAEPRLPDDGINTQLNTPDLPSLLHLLSLKRVMVWLPYLIFLILSVVLLVLNVTKSA